MSLQIGIVGLPNVGKSTLFNALLNKQAALAANYPFATIEPNVGIVAVPDERLDRLAEITKQEEGMVSLPPIKPALIEFVDIAGLVKGASEGAGLGNKFLSHIREVKIIAHVVRAFEDLDVIREGSVSPKDDYLTINTELMIADLQTIENSKKKIAKSELVILERIEKSLNEGIPVRNLKFSDEELEFVKQLSLLSAKPEIIVLNIAEGDYSEEKFGKIIEEYGSRLRSNDIAVTASVSAAVSGIASSPSVSRNDMVIISAKIESELASLEPDEQKEYLKELGVEKSGLERLIQKAYGKLGLISFLTAGEKEVRAWTVRKDSNAVEAAGEIHTDFMAKFIKAEVVSYGDFISSNGWKGARANGKARLEGRDYIMHDGDVVEFKIGR